LSPYSRYAPELDEEYQKYYSQSAITQKTSVITIDLPFDLHDGVDPTEEELRAEKNLPTEASEPRSNNPFRSFFSKDNNRKPEKGASVPSHSWKELPRGIVWCFQERQLNKSLHILRDKTNDLLALVPSLVASLSVDSKIGKLFDSGAAFQDCRGHMGLQQKARDYATGKADSMF
jgi:hypothetical protein